MPPDVRQLHNMTATEGLHIKKLTTVSKDREIVQPSKKSTLQPDRKEPS